MTKPWTEVAESDGFKALPPDEQDEARRQYFDDVVAPKVPAEHIDVAWDQFSTDAGVGRRELPAGVAPSKAGGGRGTVNPTSLSLTPQAPAPTPAAIQPTAIADPSGASDAAAIMDAAQPRRESVLEGRQMPAPEFDATEAARLSSRAYAERTPLPGDPRMLAPSMRQSPGIEPATQATQRGQGLADTSMPVRAAAKAVAGIAQGAGGTVRAAGDFTGSKTLQAAGQSIGEGATQFDRGLGERTSIEGFGPKSPAPYLANMAEGAASSLAQSAAYASAFGAGAVIPLMSIQTAGQEYEQARKSGLDPFEAFAGAVPKGIFEAVGEKFTGLDRAAGAMGVLLNKGASAQAKRTAGEVLFRAGFREVPGELITYLGQTGVDLLPGIGLNQNMTMGQFIDGLRDTVVQSVMMGGAMGGAAAHATAGKPPEPSLNAEQMARDRGFLITDKVRRLKEGGDTVAAAALQKGLDAEKAALDADTELAAMATAAPDQVFHGKPEFQDLYRQLRTDGMKPAEASARAAMATGFSDIGQQVGISPKAVEKAIEATQDMPLEKVPGFLEKFVAKLTGAGMGKPVPEGTVAGAVGAQGNTAMNAVIDSVYTDAPPTDAALELEQNQSQAPENSDLAAINSEVDAAAHAAATSPLNDLPEPTDAQKEAGNYKVGRLNLHGLNISIENPAGSERSGTSPDGTRWSNTLQSHYGYIRGTEGNDGDHVDTFIGPNPASQRVFVVDQINADGSFDEHKVLLGFDSLEQADAGYHANYHAGWTGRGAITEVPLDEFKDWVRDGIKDKPLGNIAKAAPAENNDQAPVIPVNKNGFIERSRGWRVKIEPHTQGSNALDPNKDIGALLYTIRGDAPMDMVLSVDGTLIETHKALAPDNTSNGKAWVPPNEETANKAKDLLSRRALTDINTPERKAIDAQIKDLVLNPPAKTTSEQAEQADQQSAAPKKPKGGQNLRRSSYDKNPLLTFIATHGLFHDKTKPNSLKSEFSPDKAILVPGFGPVFKKTGQNLDTLTQLAIEDGYLPPDGDERQLYDLIRRAIGGEKIEPLYAAGMAEKLGQDAIDARYEDYLADQEAAAEQDDFDPFGPLEGAGYTLDDAKDAGYDGASEQIKLEVNALLAQAEAAGIDTDTIKEQAYEETRNGTEQDYLEAARDALQAALQGSDGNSGQDAGSEGDARGEEVNATHPQHLPEGGAAADGREGANQEQSPQSGRQDNIPASGDGNDGGREQKYQSDDSGQRSDDGSNAADQRPSENASVKQTQTPSTEGVSVSGFTFDLSPTGTLRIKGDQTAIRAKLQAGGVTRMTPMTGGVVVGKTEADKARAILEGKPAATPKAQVLSIGITPATAEAVTVKDGIVHIGKNEAIDFDSGEPIRVPDGATDAQIIQKLRDAGALSRHAKVFGLHSDGANGLNEKAETVEQISPTAIKSGDAQDSTPERPEALIELRKRMSVLKSLRECLGA